MVLFTEVHVAGPTRAEHFARLPRPGAREAMKQEDVVASAVQLAEPIKAEDREGKEQTLRTVGDAAHFILVNLTLARAGDIDWKIAASALERAAETGTEVNTVHATKAVIALLETEKLIRR
jgi:hypothetical protein